MSTLSNTSLRDAFYRRIDVENLAPLWEVLGSLVPPTPRSVCQPAHWSFENVRPHLYEAGRLISAEEAERRVLVLENPALRGRSSITQSLYAGYQLLLPGEVAHSHRHSATAIRLVIEGQGACTSVDGERTTMMPGDFIITPSWTFHDHGNMGEETVVWLDGLDVPLIQYLEAGFSERYPDASQPLTKPDDDSLARYGDNMLPFDHMLMGRNPIFRYPYEKARAKLHRLVVNGPINSCHGVKLQYVNPSTGESATATMAAFMQMLPPAFQGAPYRSTDSTVFCVVEGSGTSFIDGQRYDWRPHDVFVVPSWMQVRHATGNGAVLFSFSDRPVQEALGLWREAVDAAD